MTTKEVIKKRLTLAEQKQQIAEQMKKLSEKLKRVEEKQTLEIAALFKKHNLIGYDAALLEKYIIEIANKVTKEHPHAKKS